MFNKLFTSLLDSSVWLEPNPTRIVWITLLAAMDEDGFAHFAAIENLASRARVTLEEATKAVECFLAPDPNSSNPDNEGRRVERVPGGFMILNHEAFRMLSARAVQREQTRLRVKKHREAEKSCNGPSVTEALHIVTPETESVFVQERKSAEKGNPAELLEQLGALYKRKGKRFNYGEESVFAELARRPGFTEEVSCVLAYRAGIKHNDLRYFPQSLSSLLNKWDEILDRAGGQDEIEPKSPMERDIDNLCK